MTQAELGKRIGRSEATVSRIEVGLLPYSQYTLEAIAAALGEEPERLISCGPGQAVREGIDQQVLELSISVTLRGRPRAEIPQLARTARILYRLLAEKKARGVAVNDEVAVQTILEELDARGDT
jgi:transcriptional regulator with XRE-family HTH domain